MRQKGYNIRRRPVSVVIYWDNKVIYVLESKRTSNQLLLIVFVSFFGAVPAIKIFLAEIMKELIVRLARYGNDFVPFDRNLSNHCKNRIIRCGKTRVLRLLL
jgi:hypothetical protein